MSHQVRHKAAHWDFLKSETPPIPVGKPGFQFCPRKPFHSQVEFERTLLQAKNLSKCRRHAGARSHARTLHENRFAATRHQLTQEFNPHPTPPRKITKTNRELILKGPLNGLLDHYPFVSGRGATFASSASYLGSDGSAQLSSPFSARVTGFPLKLMNSLVVSSETRHVGGSKNE